MSSAGRTMGNDLSSSPCPVPEQIITFMGLRSWILHSWTRLCSMYYSSPSCFLQCSITCGSGIETRYVACMVLDDLEEQMATLSECDVSVKPSSERTCNKDPCVEPQDFDVISISSNRVIGSSHWRAGPWGGVSGEWQRIVLHCFHLNSSKT